MSDVKTLFTSANPFSFVDFITLISLGLIPSLLAAFLSRYLTVITTPAFWGLQGNPGFFFTASYSGLSEPPVRAIPTHAWPQHLSLVAEEYSITSSILNSKAKTMSPMLPSSAACWRWNMTPCSIIASPAFCFLWLPLLPKLGCSGTCSVGQAVLKLRDLLTSIPECWY